MIDLPEIGDTRHDALLRRWFVLEETGFGEVPEDYRKFYRKWRGPSDSLAANEALCPMCKVVIRSTRELWPGDGVYCMPCMSHMVVVTSETGTLEARLAPGPTASQGEPDDKFARQQIGVASGGGALNGRLLALFAERS